MIGGRLDHFCGGGHIVVFPGATAVAVVITVARMAEQIFLNHIKPGKKGICESYLLFNLKNRAQILQKIKIIFLL